jgi:hypothetical protein
MRLTPLPRKEFGRGDLMKDSNNMVPQVIKADVNLSRLPFFALARKRSKHLKTELIISEVHGKDRIELLWKVAANPEYGYPNLFAKRVFRVIEYLLVENGELPVPDYLDFSFYEIAKILGMEPSGKTCAEIKRALLSILFTAIETKGAFGYLDNGKRKWVEDYFHLYDRVIFAGETLDNGGIAERNRLYFSKWYIRSLNSLYIKPFDFHYWNALKKHIAGRLYEYLSLMSFATKCKPFRIDYHRLCKFLPLTAQRYFSQARQKMKDAHEELIETGFLKKVIWQKSKTDQRKWILIYYFGEKAKAEFKRGFADEAYRPVLLAVETVGTAEMEGQVESEEVEEAKPARKQKQARKELSEMAQQLADRGLTRSVAADLADLFPHEYIQQKIALHDEMKAAGQLTDNAAGWLRGAIEEDYQLSPQQQQKMQAKARRREKDAYEQEQSARAAEIQQQRIKEALDNFPTQAAWVEAHIEKRKQVRVLMDEQFKQDRPLTADELEQTRQLAIKAYPQTERDRLAEIHRHPQAYNTDLEEILHELKAASPPTTDPAGN